jgi:hypothetical protein
MTKPSNPTQLFLILILGLTSCKSEDQPPVPAEPTRIEALVEDQDKRFLQIRDIQSLAPTDFIYLQDDELATVPLNQVDIITRCRSPQHSHMIERARQFRGLSKVPTLEILPVEIFSPSLNEDAYLCDLDLDLLMRNSEHVKIELRDVNLHGLQEFANLNLDFLNETSPLPVFLFSELRERGEWLWPTADGEIVTLCENGATQRSQLIGPKRSIDDLVDQDLFAKNTQLCRFAVTSDSRTWVTPRFYLQYKQPVLRVDEQMSLVGQTRLRLRDDSIYRYELFNDSSIEAYVQLELPRAEVSVTPLHHQSISNGGHFSQFQTYPLQATWDVQGLISVSTAHAHSAPTYRIPPNRAISINLVVAANLSCFPGHTKNVAGPSVGSCLPHISSILMGYIYHIKGLPRYKVSRFDNYDIDHWKNGPRSRFAQAPRLQGHLRFWAPNKNLYDICREATEVIPDLHREPPRMGSGIGQFYVCRNQ